MKRILLGSVLLSTAICIVSFLAFFFLAIFADLKLEGLFETIVGSGGYTLTVGVCLITYILGVKGGTES